MELRFNKEILEDQASYLASLTEDSDAKHAPEVAQQQLESRDRRTTQLE